MKRIDRKSVLGEIERRTVDMVALQGVKTKDE